MDLIVLLVFSAVYLGMLLGEIPGLALDRTGVAVLGAIALLVAERVTPPAAWQAVDVSTMALLFGLMVVSAQFRLGGFYARVTERVTGAALAPPGLLAALTLTAGLLSAVLANDIVCLAMAPIVVATCAGRRLEPRPFLLALAAAANVGSAATLIGNPQNMLIGQVLGLSFGRYLLDAAVPAALGLVVVWAVIAWSARGAWSAPPSALRVAAAPFDAWQTGKGLAVLAALIVAFLCTDWPRDVLALAAAGVLLLSRRMASRDMLALVDWQLLLLFMALFVVNHALAASGTLALLEAHLAAAGVDLRQPVWLFGSTVVLSNLVSNVPAVMLLLPLADTPLGGPILALASTLAGNLILVGSIANLIVVDQAARLGVRIGWAEHARVGVPITLISLALAAAWLWLRA
ncbi:MAG: SLC13 family permease [Deltaproteobacteria bacterium]|nr:SLC13 family permease [Deltaproteobacteria bacterium]